jgi:hypothetical protein
VVQNYHAWLPRRRRLRDPLDGNLESPVVRAVIGKNDLVRHTRLREDAIDLIADVCASVKAAQDN